MTPGKLRFTEAGKTYAASVTPDGWQADSPQALEWLNALAPIPSTEAGEPFCLAFQKAVREFRAEVITRPEPDRWQGMSRSLTEAAQGPQYATKDKRGRRMCWQDSPGEGKIRIKCPPLPKEPKAPRQPKTPTAPAGGNATPTQPKTPAAKKPAKLSVDDAHSHITNMVQSGYVTDAHVTGLVAKLSSMTVVQIKELKGKMEQAAGVKTSVKKAELLQGIAKAALQGAAKPATKPTPPPKQPKTPKPPKPPKSSPNLESAIVAGMKSLDSQWREGATVLTRDLRNHMHPDQRGHDTFDKAVIKLAEEGKLVLHRHDQPSFLTDQERDELVQHDGMYFTTVAFRDGKAPEDGSETASKTPAQETKPVAVEKTPEKPAKKKPSKPYQHTPEPLPRAQIKALAKRGYNGWNGMDVAMSARLDEMAGDILAGKPSHSVILSQAAAFVDGDPESGDWGASGNKENHQLAENLLATAKYTGRDGLRRHWKDGKIVGQDKPQAKKQEMTPEEEEARYQAWKAKRDKEDEESPESAGYPAPISNPKQAKE